MICRYSKNRPGVSQLTTVSLYFSVLLCSATSWSDSVPRSDLWVPNGPVYATASNPATLYIGGDFNYVGPNTGSGVVINATDGIVDDEWPLVDGQVNITVADGSGGWFIGGDFTQVGGQPYGNIAHIKADKTVDGWNPDANAAINSLVLSADGNTLYAGGLFTTLDTGGTAIPRNYIAALDTTATVPANIPLAWNPNASAAVNAMTLSGNNLYVGGAFTSIGGQPRNHLAALNISLVVNNALGWNPNTEDVVNTISIAGSGPILAYVGGMFSSVNGSNRNRLASIDLATGKASAWNPIIEDGSVRTMILDLENAKLYIGGDFTTIQGQTRNGLAEVSTTGTGLVEPFDPDINGTVRSMLFNEDKTTLYVGGDFTTIGGVPRSGVGSIDFASTLVTTWNPSADGRINAMQFSGDGTTMYVGGDFTTIGGQPRSNIAAISLSNGNALVGWDPDANGAVNTLTLSSDSAQLFIGGAFTALNASTTPITRNHIALLQVVDGAVASFSPNVSGAINTMVLSSETNSLFIGGAFSMIDTVSINNIARFDLYDNSLSQWKPDANANIDSLSLQYVESSQKTSIFAGGTFTVIGNEVRTYFTEIPSIVTPETVATPDAGSYPGAQSVILACADNSASGCVDIFFTVDGSTPSTASTKYTVPISVPASTILKSFSQDNDGTREPIKTRTYIIDEAFPVTLASMDDDAYGLSQPPLVLSCTDTGGSGCKETYYTKDGSDPDLDDPDLGKSISSTKKYVVPLQLKNLLTLEGITLADVPIEDVSLFLITLDVIPLDAINLDNIPLSIVPDQAITGASVPLSILPTGTILFDSIPLQGLPDNAINITPPEGARTLADIPTQNWLLNNISLIDVPQGAIIESAISLAQIPPEAVTLSNITLDDITLGPDDPPTYDLALIQLEDIPVEAIPIQYLSDNVTIKFVSVDGAGNRESVDKNIRQYVVDLAPPTTTASIPGNIYVPPKTVVLSCSDGTSSAATGCADTFYTLDGNVPDPDNVEDPNNSSSQPKSTRKYTEPFVLESGTMIRFLSVDNIGNREVERTEIYAFTAATTDSRATVGRVDLAVVVILLLGLVLRRQSIGRDAG